MNTFLKIVIPLCFAHALTKDIPSFLRPCKRDDVTLGECMTRTAYEIVPKLKNGISELALDPLDPLLVSNVSFSTGGESMRLDVKLKNLKVMGLELFVVKNLTTKINEGIFNFAFYVPQLRIVADYEIEGKLLAFAVAGIGRCELNGSDVSATTLWWGKLYEKGGEKYIRFDKLDIEFDIKNVTVHFENLFGGNEELTLVANKMFNENINILKEELQPVIKNIINDVLTDYVNKLHSEYTMDQLFPL
ncbi:uncharacterized protein LOC116172454 [Photinus pyralis]|uniref:uncharacterized protein LOC116172454 n=1 Tax=Photinus pyralis TaxID=7054 RepID=UPI001267812F|nr:uncharacterized protein LOC116172454 [Photinus pyralis]